MNILTGPVWAIVELMGHRILAGHVTETTLAGAGMLRIDIYPGDAAEPIASPMHPPSALYGLTPCTEERARIAAEAAYYDGGLRLALPAPPQRAYDGPAWIGPEEPWEEPEPEDLDGHGLCDGDMAPAAPGRR